MANWHQMTEGRDNPKAMPSRPARGPITEEYGADYAYQSFAQQFNAELFDPDQWADIFLRSARKYVVQNLPAS